MKAYKTCYERVISEYLGDHSDGRFVLIFPEIEIKVLYSAWHFSVKKENFSLIKNVRKFEEGDESYKLLPNVSATEWKKNMEANSVLGYKYTCLEVDVEDDIGKKLKNASQLSKEESSCLDKKLKDIVFN